jgi:hypothetical protein
MPQPPANPKIYHIVHVDRLASIVSDGCLWSDAMMAGRKGTGTVIGMKTIKERRRRLPVTCHPGDQVGDYVPFYFCPRSIMLFVIYLKKHSELTYRGGQGPIIHLEADLHEVATWAGTNGRRWAFSLSNAGASNTQFRSRLDQLNEVNWSAVDATDFRPADVKKGKQAEFLVHESFAWKLVERVGVSSQAICQRVANATSKSAHQPPVEIKLNWCY